MDVLFGNYRGRAYEFELSRVLLDVLEETPGVTFYGLTDRRRLEERVPTVSFTLKGWHPRKVSEELDKAGIYVWDGNYYTLAVTERLGSDSFGIFNSPCSFNERYSSRS